MTSFIYCLFFTEGTTLESVQGLFLLLQNFQIVTNGNVSRAISDDLKVLVDGSDDIASISLFE